MSLASTNILLAVTASVAAIRLHPLIAQLQARGASIRLLVTAAADHFVRNAHPPLPPIPIYTDDAEWKQWRTLGDPVLHIELRRWAHLLLIAPLSANTLAKIATGLCDNLVTCVARAWPIRKAPLIVAPAMNSEMWSHPITEVHLQTLRQWDVHIVPPVSKKLACGDVGVGAMESAQVIVDTVEKCVQHD